MADRRYYNNFFVTQLPYRVTSNCANIAFYNAGTSTVVIASAITIAPGVLFSMDGKENEMDTTLYQIAFTGGGINNCVVIRKEYAGQVDSGNPAGTDRETFNLKTL